MKNYLFIIFIATSLSVTANPGKSLSSTQFVQLPGSMTEVRYFYPEGTLMQIGYMENGVKTGEWITYNREGNITAKAYYDHGKKVGKWKIYNDAGEVVYKIQYRDNKKIWAQQYDADGNTIAFNYN